MLSIPIPCLPLFSFLSAPRFCYVTLGGRRNLAPRDLLALALAPPSIRSRNSHFVALPVCSVASQLRCVGYSADARQARPAFGLCGRHRSALAGDLLGARMFKDAGFLAANLQCPPYCSTGTPSTPCSPVGISFDNPQTYPRSPWATAHRPMSPSYGLPALALS